MPLPDLLDLSQFPFAPLFTDPSQPWTALARLPAFLASRPRYLNEATLIGSSHIAPDVSIGRGTVIHPGAVLLGPTIIGEDCEVRANCFIRGHVVVGHRCVLGNASEFKNAILFNESSAPHFSYVGDSILGHRAHLGAGTILSNKKSLNPDRILIHDGNSTIDTNLSKFGAVLGDHAEIGCNCVLSPGSIIGRRSVLYPNILWRGVCPPDTIVKLRQEQLIETRRT